MAIKEKWRWDVYYQIAPEDLISHTESFGTKKEAQKFASKLRKRGFWDVRLEKNVILIMEVV